MNPLWFFIGLEVGDRIQDRFDLRRIGQSAVREGYWFIQGEVEKWRGGNAYRRFIDSLPTTERGE